MPPTLQAIADSVIWADLSIEAVATMWVDAGCPRLTEAETAVLAHVAAMDLDSPEFWQAVRRYRGEVCGEFAGVLHTASRVDRQELDRNKLPTPTEEPG